VIAADRRRRRKRKTVAAESTLAPDRRHRGERAGDAPLALQSISKSLLRQAAGRKHFAWSVECESLVARVAYSRTNGEFTRLKGSLRDSLHLSHNVQPAHPACYEGRSVPSSDGCGA
jgi:hypothetical protein